MHYLLVLNFVSDHPVEMVAMQLVDGIAPLVTAEAAVAVTVAAVGIDAKTTTTTVVEGAMKNLKTRLLLHHW